MSTEKPPEEEQQSNKTDGPRIVRRGKRRIDPRYSTRNNDMTMRSYLPHPTVYDAVSGKITSRQQNRPFSPDEVLVRNQMKKFSNPQWEAPIPSPQLLQKMPDSGLLEALHYYVSAKFTLPEDKLPSSGSYLLNSMDETALIALGIVVEEWMKELVNGGPYCDEDELDEIRGVARRAGAVKRKGKNIGPQDRYMNILKAGVWERRDLYANTFLDYIDNTQYMKDKKKEESNDEPVINFDNPYAEDDIFEVPETKTEDEETGVENKKMKKTNKEKKKSNVKKEDDDFEVPEYVVRREARAAAAAASSSSKAMGKVSIKQEHEEIDVMSAPLKKKRKKSKTTKKLKKSKKAAGGF
ncbi:hypothetical protein DASC09_011920 [Saccharomycopsis crataegensis]|uniref:Uncharacterized protein n=1 Tax=Saccharomycopsis crataegensis TaxID=43959 RepID=A0AAV5QGF3_9ASCO|nr:hypothetical protein DASC09_011920 [Saccharomycopsis crataegensis]